jgi:putative FmdB family regulatory protein
MPVYEYYCKSCDGVFEAIRPIAKASEPSPCPVCAKKAERMMPSSFSAFTMREGYPRAIPDRGTYYHLGKEVKKPITGPTRMNEHPEINKPQPKPRKSKGELSAQADRKQAIAKEQARQRKDGVPQIIDRRARNDD